MTKKILTMFTIISYVGTVYSSGAELPVPELNGTISLMDIAASESGLYFTCALNEEEKHIRFFSWEDSKWNEVLLPENAKAGGFLDLELVGEVPYLLFNNNDGLTLAKYQDKEWKLVGKYGFAGNSAGTDFLQLAFCGDQPFVLFRDLEAGQIELWTHEIHGALSIWTTADMDHTDFMSGEQPVMCSAGTNKLVVASYQRSLGGVNALSYDNVSGEMKEVNKGIPAKNVANLISLKCVDDKVYLAYEDRSKSYAVSLLRLDESQQKWIQVEIPGNIESTGFYLASDMSIGFRNESKKPVFIEHSENKWGSPEEITAGSASTLRITSFGTTKYYAFLDAGDGNKLKLIKI